MSNENKPKLQDDVKARTYAKVELPRLASFLLLAVQTLSRVYMLLAFAAIIAFILSVRLNWPMMNVVGFTAVFYILSLVVATQLISQKMAADGVLELYLSTLVTDTALGRWLVRSFGKVKENK